MGGEEPKLGFGVQGSGCRVQGAGFKVQGSGFRIHDVECMVVQGTIHTGLPRGSDTWGRVGCAVQGSGFGVQGSGFSVQCSGFRDQG